MNSAVLFLRRRSVWRALHSYRVWIGRAIGWWSIVYLIFWLVVFALSGLEMIVRQDQPFAGAIWHVPALLVALLFLALAAAGAAPPVVLDRRDLYRLALAPSVPRDVMRYRMNLRRVLTMIGAAFVGALWSLLAPPYLHLSAPWAAAAAASLALGYFEVSWLRYAGYRRDDAHGAAARRAAAVAIAVVVLSAAGPALVALSTRGGWAGAVDVLTRLSPLAALRYPDASVLILPLAVALYAHLAVRRSLAGDWPPRFAAQSLVLTQLQAMRAFQMLAGLAGASGAAGAREADAGERQRLLAALHDRPGATRPSRSLRPPRLDAEPWQAIAWRGAQQLHRRPRFAQLRAALLALAAASSLLAAAQAVAGARLFAATASGPGAAAGAGGLAGSFAGAIGVLLGAFVMARASAALLGPTLAATMAPVAANQRTRGRTTPVLVVMGVATLIGLPLLYLATGLASNGGLAIEPSAFALSLGAYAVLALTCVFALEKYSSWSGVAPSRWEPQVVAALLVALPVIVFVAFDAAAWTMPAQLVLLAVVWLIEV